MNKLFRGLCLISFLVLASTAGTANADDVQTPFGMLPSQIKRGSTSPSGNLHVQGVQVDAKRGYIYYSFTTELVKTDLKGNVIGSVQGLTCHLGCIELDTETGLLYGSMEYKDDIIGQGILRAIKQGQGGNTGKNCFYVGIFDTNKITRAGMSPTTDGVLTAAYLPDVVAMYQAKVVNNGKKLDHKYGCSGIDGISLGPQFGKTDGKKLLNVALGIYGDNERTDNDYQILLQYDPVKLQKVAKPLVSGNFHQSGMKAMNTYFVFTGNTTWGVQNMDYDKASHRWYMAVYVGKKPTFPNYYLFAIDGTKKPVKQTLKGFVPAQKGLVLSLAEDGLKDAATGLRGWNFIDGSTGFESLGQGYFYISHPGRDEQKRQQCTLTLYKWTGNAEEPFVQQK